MRLCVAACLASLFLAAPAHAARSPQPSRGLALAQSNCAACHAVRARGASPLAAAPPFRDLHRHYDVSALEEALAEGILTGHPSMPAFEFTPAQIADFIAYLRSLEPRTRSPGR